LNFLIENLKIENKNRNLQNLVKIFFKIFFFENLKKLKITEHPKIKKKIVGTTFCPFIRERGNFWAFSYKRTPQ